MYSYTCIDPSFQPARHSVNHCQPLEPLDGHPAKPKDTGQLHSGLAAAGWRILRLFQQVREKKHPTIHPKHAWTKEQMPGPDENNRRKWDHDDLRVMSKQLRMT